ncbi:MAG TPA: acyl-CoA dehydrogenase family protein, partial [Solirubrobacteraceae bacterium]|nr:acyl-CoA dehydrogenase family protein [Solirubrobacteraceae bacterium]
TALTEPGRHLVTLAEGLADEFAIRAAEHDRDASYPHEAIEALHSAGYFTAPIPAQFGGLGTASVHDLVVAASRLARGDASVAIGVNMHMTILRNLVRRWELAVARDDERRAVAFGQTLEAVAYDGTVIASAGSEPQQDLTRPATTATRIDSGWRIDGRKIFCTMSPAATVLFTAVTFRDDDGNDRYGYARVPAGTPGMTVNDDWDALGMRASGSHSVTFDGAEVPASALRGGFPVGSVLPYIEANLTAGLFHAAASLGIAEAAHGTVTEALARRNGSFKEGRGSTLLAESTIDLSAQRAMLSRTATLVDGYYASDADGDPALVQLFAEVQAAKTFVNESATRVVDRALALSGGAGYMAGNPLARHYRDVRAGAFMHPLGSNRAYDVLAQIALSREPALH